MHTSTVNGHWKLLKSDNAFEMRSEKGRTLGEVRMAVEWIVGGVEGGGMVAGCAGWRSGFMGLWYMKR